MGIFTKRSTWTIQQITEVLGISRSTFDHHMRFDKDFPKPFISTRNKVAWFGNEVQYYFDKRSQKARVS